MQSHNPLNLSGKTTHQLCQEREDLYDALENQQRDPKETRSTDGAAVAGSLVTTLLWLLAGAIAIGGTATAGPRVLALLHGH